MKYLIIILILPFQILAQRVKIPEHIQKTYQVQDSYKWTKLGPGGLEAERIALNIPKTRVLNEVIDYLKCQTEGMSDYYKLKTVLEVVTRNVQYNNVYTYEGASNIKEYHNLFIMARGDKDFPQYVDDFDYEYPLTVNNYVKLDSLWKILKNKNGRYDTDCRIRAYNQNLPLDTHILPNGKILNNSEEFVFWKGYGVCVDKSILFTYIANKINLNESIVKTVSSNNDAHVIVEVKNKTNNTIKYIDPTCDMYSVFYVDPVNKECSLVKTDFIVGNYFMVNRNRLTYKKGFYK
jgi:hypothetical protein